MRERTLGIVPDGDGHSYVTDDDPAFAGSSMRIRAYVCFDSKKRSDDEQELKKTLMAKMKELEGRIFEDPAKSFIKRAGWLSKYLDYEVDEKGAMHLKHKNNAMSFFRNRAGMFVMLTPRMEWETVMTAYDARNNVELAFDIFKSELDGKRGRTGDPVRARGRLLIKFLALMIRVHMQSKVSKSKIKGLTVENMLMSAATYKIVDDRGVKVHTERTKRVREIFELFEVEDPAQLNTADTSE